MKVTRLTSQETCRNSSKTSTTVFGRSPPTPQKYTKFCLSSGREKSHKVFGQDIPGTSGTQTSGYPGQKLYASGPVMLFLDRAGWPGCPGIWVGTSRILEKLYARKLWADLSLPISVSFPTKISGHGLPQAIPSSQYHWEQKDYLPNLYSRRILLGNSMCFMCTKENFQGNSY